MGNILLNTRMVRLLGIASLLLLSHVFCSCRAHSSSAIAGGKELSRGPVQVSRMIFNSADSPYLADAQNDAVKGAAIHTRIVVVATR